MYKAATRGPLDITRDRTFQAAELDELARERLVDTPDMVADFETSVKALNDAHPLMGQPVIVYGSSLNAKAEAITTRALGAADTSAERHRRQSGRYGGLAIASQYFHQTGRSVLRVAHRINIGSAEFMPDDLGSVHQQFFINMVLATDSEVVPMRPLNAHSLIDLENDPVAAEVDQFVYAEGEKPIDYLPELSEVVNVGLENLGWDDGRNQQRVSYINSFHLFDGIHVSAKDFILADVDTYNGGDDLLASNPGRMANAATFIPEHFEVVAGYQRATSGTVEIGDTPELALEARWFSGQKVLILTKNIIGLELVPPLFDKAAPETTSAIIKE